MLCQKFLINNNGAVLVLKKKGYRYNFRGRHFKMSADEKKFKITCK